ncbi:inositol monophosphatase [Streptosporangium sp. NPDC020072]|uniref:inositol monophosphatase family protein n=1 Tax=Streptosporangium sp. NPDC020072 TaxID=3154788 RepID=UPI00343A240F
MSYRELLPQVIGIARQVGAYVQEHRPAAVGASVASVMEAFGTVDGPAGEFLRERLGALRPQSAWSPDEIGTVVADHGETWVCDAVDGAVQFLQGLPHWGVTITLIAGGEPVLAVLWAPQLDALYTAVKGGGAHLNGRRVRTSAKRLSAALACTSQPPYNLEPERAGASLTAMLRHTLAVRNLGPTALQVAQVGSGHVDVFWEYGHDANNLLPGSLIAREGGALVTDADGDPWTPASSTFVAAAPILHSDVLNVLRGHRGSC